MARRLIWQRMTAKPSMMGNKKGALKPLFVPEPDAILDLFNTTPVRPPGSRRAA